MTGKEFLEEARNAQNNICAYQNLLLKLRIVAYGAPISGYVNIITNKNSLPNSPEEKYIIEMSDTEEIIKELTFKYAETLKIAIKLIEKLSKNKYKCVLISYYLENDTEKGSASKLKISLRQFQNQKKSALKEFETIYSEYASKIS